MRSQSSIHPDHFGLHPNAKPVRARPKRGYTPSWDGKFAATKAWGPAPFESLLERDFQTLLTANPQIKRYGVQCHKLTYWGPDADGRSVKRTYTPDITALDRSGAISIMEVKGQSLRERANWARLEPHIREAYEQDHGVPFQVFSEPQVRAQPRLTNCEEMLRFRSPVDPEADAVIGRIVTGGRFSTLGDLLKSADERGITDDRSYGAAMRAIMDGGLVVDHSVALSDNSQAWSASR